MAKTAVAFDTSADPGERLDPAVRAEIDQLAPSTVDAGDIHESHLATDSVSTLKIKAGAVTHPKIALDAVESDNIKAGAVGTPELADNAVTAAKAGTGVVTAVDAAGNAIESREWHGSTAEYDMIDPGDLDPNTTYYITA